MVAAGGLNMVAAGGGNMVAAGGMNMVAAGGGNILSHNGGLMVAAGGGNMVAAGGGNIVAAGGGNLVAAGGGNMVAAGGGNRSAGFVDLLASRRAKTRSNSILANLNRGETAEALARAALISRYAGVNSDLAIGIITVEAGGTASAQDGGSIVAQPGGILTGSGTFTGLGLVQSGGTMMPGGTPGTLTWDGNLTFESGSSLDIEIAGTTAGTQHDVINISGACTMNGALQIRLLNGFGGSVQGTDVFDIVNAGSPITTSLAGTRISAAGSNGTFEVQLANNGQTLRLTNYQAGPVTFSSFASRYGLSGANASMTADPNNNGLSNLLEYALGRDSTAIGGSRGTSVGTVIDGGQKYLSLSYTRPTGANAPTDIIYTPELSTALNPATWSSSANDLLTHSIAPGPGNLETVTVRSTYPLSQTAREFLHLKVTLTSP